jgi:hypothetical protein
VGNDYFLNPFGGISRLDYEAENDKRIFVSKKSNEDNERQSEQGLCLFIIASYILCLKNLTLFSTILVVCHERTFYIESVRNCTRDEGRPLEAGLQEQASNHLKLRW